MFRNRFSFIAVLLLMLSFSLSGMGLSSKNYKTLRADISTPEICAGTPEVSRVAVFEVGHSIRELFIAEGANRGVSNFNLIELPATQSLGRRNFARNRKTYGFRLNSRLLKLPETVPRV